MIPSSGPTLLKIAVPEDSEQLDLSRSCSACPIGSAISLGQKYMKPGACACRLSAG